MKTAVVDVGGGMRGIYAAGVLDYCLDQGITFDLGIDRENPRNALVTVQKAADLLTSDTVNVAIYPEGTRSKNCTLLPFHNGVFKIAQKVEVPIAVSGN